MEVIDWSPPQSLKLSNLNHLPKDTARQTESLKWVLSAYTQGKDIESWIPHIFENCLSTGAPRAVRVLSYMILRMIVGKYKIDWSSISGTLSRDITNHTDQELQVIAVRILPLLPFDDLVVIVSNLERDFMKILCGESGIGARIAYLDILPSILIKLWVNLNAEHLSTADMIREIYTYILTLMLESDDNLSRLSFSALKLLYEEREFAKSISLNHEFEGNGSYREMLTSLIDYLSPKLLPGILIILKRYNALNIRLRGSLFFGLCSCILDLVKKHYSKHVRTEVELKSGVIELKELVNRFIFEGISPLLESLDAAIVWEAGTALIELVKYFEIPKDFIWNMCNKVLELNDMDFSQTASLKLVSTALFYLPASWRLSLSLHMIERSIQVSNRIERLTIMLACLKSMFTLSVDLVSNSQQSAVYQLFSQDWFVRLWVDPQDSIFREEMLSCLANIALVYKSDHEAWVTVGLEVADICMRVLEWQCGEEQRSFGPENYCSLLDELFSYLPASFNTRRAMILDHLFNKVKLDKFQPRTIANGLNKYLSIYLLSKYWEPVSQEDMKLVLDAITEKLVDTRIISLLQEPSYKLYKKIQTLLLSCLYLCKRYASQLGNSMAENVTSFCKMLEGVSKVEHLLHYSHIILANITQLQLDERFILDPFDLAIAHPPSIASSKDFEFIDTLHASLNIFDRISPRLVTSYIFTPLSILKYISQPEVMNWRCTSSKLISGIGDPVHVVATHVIYPAYSLVLFVFTITNVTKFELTNLNIQFLHSSNINLAVNQYPTKTIESLSTLEKFDYKLRCVISDCGMISCTLKLTYELDEDDCRNSSVILNKYNVPISQILLKDGSSFSSVNSYMMLWSRLIYIIEIRCEVLDDIDSVISNISLLMELTITQTFKKFTRWGFQAATLQGDRIALVLKKRHTRNYASIDIRTSTEKSYEAMSETMREFIRDISKNKLELLE